MVKIMFGCKKCRLMNIRVEVEEPRQNQSQAEYMEGVGQAVAFQHAFYSPECDSDTVDIYVPELTSE